jgi:hypothetical protein
MRTKADLGPISGLRKSRRIERAFGNRPKEDTLWYYRELANAFQGLLPGQLAEELMEIVIVLENE